MDNYVKMAIRKPDSIITERLVHDNDADLEMALAIEESLKLFEIRQDRISSCVRLLNTLKRVIPYDEGIKKAYEYLLDSLETYYDAKPCKKENADFIKDQLTKVRLHQEDVTLLSNIL